MTLIGGFTHGTALHSRAELSLEVRAGKRFGWLFVIYTDGRNLIMRLFRHHQISLVCLRVGGLEGGIVIISMVIVFTLYLIGFDRYT